ncbi:MAG: hypothetical protein M9924_00610 [Rhizobiaceae bacterium]|nr:hypothetical protein [Rhizobiaceae bacterium]
MDRLLFGDNQFFGINHMSEEKARAQAMKFQDLSEIIAVLDAAYDEGIRTFMCTTHDRIALVCDHIRANPKRYEGFKFYPCMPYAHKYANAVTDHGMMGAISHFMPDEGLVKTALKGGLSLAKKDIEGLATILIDMEMKMFKGLETPVIFLQNVVVDLLLGMGMKDSFRIFHDYVREKYNAEAGFITMNLPMLLDTLDEVGIKNPIVCANINKIGFRLSGGIDSYLETLKRRKVRAIAMSVFASGAIAPREAIEWVAEQDGIEAIVFGASSRKNIRDTKTFVDAAYA